MTGLQLTLKQETHTKPSTCDLFASGSEQVDGFYMLTSEISCQGAPIAREPLVGRKDHQVSNPPGPDSQEAAHNQQYEHQQHTDEYNTACTYITYEYTRVMYMSYHMHTCTWHLHVTEANYFTHTNEC